MRSSRAVPHAHGHAPLVCALQLNIPDRASYARLKSCISRYCVVLTSLAVQAYHYLSRLHMCPDLDTAAPHLSVHRMPVSGPDV